MIGLVPVLGEAADGINAAWYAAEGDYVNAGLSAAAMVPVFGWAATGGKFGYKAVRSMDGARNWWNGRPTMVPPHAAEAVFTPNAKFSTGQKYEWTDPATGKKVSYHAHGRDPGIAPTQHAGAGPVYRVRIGNHFLGADGVMHTRNSLDPKSSAFNPEAANQTHIPFPNDQPSPDRTWRPVLAPNPVAVLGPDGVESE